MRFCIIILAILLAVTDALDPLTREEKDYFLGHSTKEAFAIASSRFSSSFRPPLTKKLISNPDVMQYGEQQDVENLAFPSPLVLATSLPSISPSPSPSPLTPSSLPASFVGIVAGVAIPVGLIILSFGCRIFRITAFFICAIAAGAPTFFISLAALDDTHSEDIAAGFAGLSALLVGGIALRYPKVVDFIISSSLGVLISFILNIYVYIHAFPKAGNIPLIVSSCLLGVGTGVLGIYLTRVVRVLSTSLIGSFITVIAIAHFIGTVNFISIAEQVRDHGIESLSIRIYIYIASVIALTVIGFLVQACLTMPPPDKSSRDKKKERRERRRAKREAKRRKKALKEPLLSSVGKRTKSSEKAEKSSQKYAPPPPSASERWESLLASREGKKKKSPPPYYDEYEEIQDEEDYFDDNYDEGDHFHTGKDYEALDVEDVPPPKKKGLFSFLK